MSRYIGTLAAGAAMAGLALAAGPAMAQKSKDTLRAISEQPISLVDRIYNAQPATTLMSSVIFDSLVEYDSVHRKFMPALAKSWKRINATTLEFKLRDDIKFHDGSKFDADDVVFTINWVVDPTKHFRFKASRYAWLKGAEKIDQYTVRVYSKGPYAPALSRLGANLLIYPSDTFSKTGPDFGKHPIGTGPYKVTQVDPNKGVVMVKFDGFRMASAWRPAGKIGKIVVQPVADRQTQIARMMVGDQDFMYHVPTDQAEAMGKDPRFKVYIGDTISFSYLQFDTANRSGIGVFKDQRVRRAVSEAINREAIKKALFPKQAQHVPLPDGMCHKWLSGCDYSAKPPEYNPKDAIKLLKEAGYANGFNVELTSWGPLKAVAEAITGDLRKVGIRAKVDHVVYGTYSKKRKNGQLQALVSFWDNGGAQPDIETTLGFFYSPGDRDYVQDPVLHEAAKKSQTMFDPTERTAYLKEHVFNRVIEKNYFMPLIAQPAVIVHTKDLVLKGGHKSPEGFLYNYMEWAK